MLRQLRSLLFVSLLSFFTGCLETGPIAEFSSGPISDVNYREDGELGSFLSATYPQVSLNADDELRRDALNALIQHKFLARLSTWRDWVIVGSRESKEGMEVDPDSYSGASFQNWKCEITYELGCLREDCVSLVMMEYWYTGGAHGNWSFRPLNYWWVEDEFREVSLADLFNDTEHWDEELDLLIWEGYLGLLAERVEAQYLDAVEREEEYLEGIHRDAPFHISKEGIQFYYAPYALNSFAVGDFRILIPWNRMEGILAPEVSSEAWAPK